MKGKNSGDKLIECGHIGRAVGIKGDVALFWRSGTSPVSAGDEILVGRDSKKVHAIKLSAIKKRGRFYLARLEGISDRKGAENFRGVKLFIPRALLTPLPKGEYYTYQILGMDVFTEDGEFLGKVAKTFSAGGHDVYEVRDGKKEILIPAVDHVVRSIDLATKKIVVRLLEGM